MSGQPCSLPACISCCLHLMIVWPTVAPAVWGEFPGSRFPQQRVVCAFVSCVSPLTLDLIPGSYDQVPRRHQKSSPRNQTWRLMIGPGVGSLLAWQQWVLSTARAEGLRWGGVGILLVGAVVMESCRPAESLSRKQTGQEGPLGGEPRAYLLSRGASPLGEGPLGCLVPTGSPSRASALSSARW